MDKIGFVGAYDKTDVILYIAKIISLIGKKVLVIDSTINQKAKYVVPVINPTKSYITNFEGMDIAVGFNNLQQIQEYLGTEDKKIDYDIILIDIDSTESIEIYDMKEANKNYFVTSFDLYSLKKGIEIIDGLNETIQLKKVLFSKYATEEEDDYLNFLSLGHKVIWESERIYFPLELGDQSTIIENQMLSKIKIRKLTNQYKKSLLYMAEEIVKPEERGKIRKVFRQLEKEV
ncbi:putative uncharacterized protein [Clostridium sp. CAG:798]|jgi:hypothetical protein|nr:putative uncharacterized protein [Clostridium sp. CAG:798]